MSYKICVLNLGGTSTKMSIFEDEKNVDTISIVHSVEEMNENPTSKEQVKYRRAILEKLLSENGYTVDDFDAFVMHAPPFGAKKSGVYEVTGKCREMILNMYRPDEKPRHGNRVVLPLIDELIGDRDIPVFTVDPPGCDEFSELAHISGMPDYPRECGIHQLNQKAFARKYAKDIGRSYDDLKLIVCHLGGGISIAAHEYGTVVDANKPSVAWGPFSSDRAGTVSADVMLKICYDEGKTKEEAYQLVRGNAGLKAHLGTVDLREIEKMITGGDKHAELIFNAMAYQIAKEIGCCYAVLKGRVDAIIFTGGMAHSDRLVGRLTNYVGTFAPIVVYAGELEQEALAGGAYRVLSGEEDTINYTLEDQDA